MLRIAILGSTRGTNLVPIVEAIRAQRLAAEIVIVVSNKQDAGILAKARHYNLKAIALPAHPNETREHYDQRLAEILKLEAVDLIVLIGFMRILSTDFIRKFTGKIINVHPSLLPKYKGLMDLAVHQAVLDQGETETGCSVHLVTEMVDSGKILIQNCCKIDKNDNAESLKTRVQALEGPALIEAIQLFIKESS
jgi:phosphoribosylglycinamide formyltransferase 1